MERYSIRFWGLMICILLVAVVIFIISTDTDWNEIWIQIKDTFEDVLSFLSDKENDNSENTDKKPSDYPPPFVGGGAND